MRPGEVSPSSPMGLGDYLGVARRRKWTIVVTTAGLLCAALATSLLQTPIFESTAQLLIQTQARDSIFDPVTGARNDPARAVEGEILVLESEPVRSMVRQRLGSAPEISTSGIGNADGIEVVAASPDRHRAAQVANAYAESYLEFRRSQASKTLLEAGEGIRGKIAQLQTELDGLDAEIEQNDAPGTGVAQLVARRDSLVQQQALFNQKLDEVEVDASVKGNEALLLTPAQAATSPVSPKPVRDALLAAVVGLLAGGGIALLREHLDDSIKTKEDVDAAVGPVPVLGLLPSVPGWKDRSRPMVVSLTEPLSPAAESYRSLRTSIQFLGFERPLRLLQVTSPSSSEGKTTTLANLAVALAGAGNSVVAVCCDLRRPRLHQFFGLSNAVGFTSVLVGEVELEDALQGVPGTERLALLASGPIPPNPSEMLSSRRASEVLGALQSHADVVLIDCPPVLPVTDAAVLSDVADGTLLVSTAGVTRKRELFRAAELLHQVDAPLVGVALNGAAEQGSYGYGYGYVRQEEESHPAKNPFAVAVFGRG